MRVYEYQYIILCGPTESDKWKNKKDEPTFQSSFSSSKNTWWMIWNLGNWLAGNLGSPPRRSRTYSIIRLHSLEKSLCITSSECKIQTVETDVPARPEVESGINLCFFTSASYLLKGSIESDPKVERGIGPTLWEANLSIMSSQALEWVDERELVEVVEMAELSEEEERERKDLWLRFMVFMVWVTSEGVKEAKEGG